MHETAILCIHALTGMHPGSGTALGVVDLPVQRERHTQWPLIPASSLKGVLRSHCSTIMESGDENILAVFGTETSDPKAHAGALSLTDARILAFPVRSMKGVFAWVTCPAALTRLKRDLAIAGMKLPDPIPSPGPDQIICDANSPLLIVEEKKKTAVLEEFEFTHCGQSDHIADWIANHSTQDSSTAERIRSHLAILHDDDFTHFVRHATEVLARVGLDYERKTVKKGALFYEEFLPPECLFYTIVLATRSHRETCPKTAGETLAWIRDNIPDILQIGGDETIGKGLCAVKIVKDGRE